jgi:hypothetical protein
MMRHVQLGYRVPDLDQALRAEVDPPAEVAPDAAHQDADDDGEGCEREAEPRR